MASKALVHCQLASRFQGLCQCSASYGVKTQCVNLLTSWQPRIKEKGRVQSPLPEHSDDPASSTQALPPPGATNLLTASLASDQSFDTWYISDPNYSRQRFVSCKQAELPNNDHFSTTAGWLGRLVIMETFQIEAGMSSVLGCHRGYFVCTWSG